MRRMCRGFATGCVSLLAISCGSGSGTAVDSGGSHAGGGGGQSGGGSGGTGGSGSSVVDTHPVDAGAFCLAEYRALCSLAFQCVPSAGRDSNFTSTFGSSLSECQNTIMPSMCTTATTDCPVYDTASASICITTLISYSCADLANFAETAECTVACSLSTGTGGTIGTGGRASSGSGGGSGGAGGLGGQSGAGGISGSGGRFGSGGVTGLGGTTGLGGATGSGGKTGGTGGSSGQLPLCPADYETAECPVAGQSCRIDCASNLCGCTCQSLGDRMLWSCLLL